MNRIAVVSADASITSQACAYAEYRAFAVVARHTRRVRNVRLVLRHAAGRGTCGKVTCSVTAVLEDGSSLRIRVTGPHVYAAINRAVERLGPALGQRIEQRLSS